MFACFQPHSTQVIPKHLAVKMDPSWLLSHKPMYTLIDWACTNNIPELTMFTNSTSEVNLVDFITKIQPREEISWHLVTTNPTISSSLRLHLYNMRWETSRLCVYIYIDYDFQKELDIIMYNHFDILLSVHDRASEPDYMICTGGQNTLKGTCLKRIENTKLCIIRTEMVHCDEEVWNDCLEHFS